MKLKFTFFISFLFISLAGSAQWIQKANFPGNAKAKSTSFTIGNKIYVMGGVNAFGTTLNDFWEYDILANTWLQKPNFPGPERYGATSFVISNRGYIATGGNDFGYLDDLWEYNPVTNSWIQKTGLPAGQPQRENQRREAYAFVIGTKAYLGGGDGFVFGANNTFNTAFYDLWEYNPVTDSWHQKADMPDFIGKDFSIGVSMNGKGYVGLGCNVDQNVNHQGFWEYDPVSDSWISKSNFPTLYTTDASAFVLDSGIYVVGGVNLNPVSLTSQVYRYDLITDSWSALSNFNGGALAGAFTASTGTAAFVGTGYTGALTTRNDLWEIGTVTTGISQNNLQADLGLEVYPNPANEYVSVRSKNKLSSVEVYDALGALMLKEENTFDKMNVRDLNTGLYEVRVTDQDGMQVFTRFMKVN